MARRQAHRAPFRPIGDEFDRGRVVTHGEERAEMNRLDGKAAEGTMLGGDNHVTSATENRQS